MAEEEVTLTPKELEQALTNVIEQAPSDHRLRTYARALHQIPAAELNAMARILEVGISDRIFKFAHLFSPNAQFFGLTLDHTHAVAAQSAPKRPGQSAEIKLQDLRQGLPEDWGNMDLALDIYSASHYSDPFATIDFLAQSLEPGGYCIIVAGGLPGIAEYARQHPDRDWPSTRWVYKRQEKKITVRRFSKEDPETNIQLIAENLREGGFNLPKEPNLDDIVQAVEKTAQVLGVDTVTSADMLFMAQYHRMEKAGLTDIRKFETEDGEGIIGRKI